MSPEVVAAIAGAGLSLLFAYAPKVREWYAAQSGDRKRQVMGLAIVGAAGVVTAASCVPQLGAVVPADWVTQCNEASIGELVRLTFYALAVNQATFSLAVRAAPAVG